MARRPRGHWGWPRLLHWIAAGLLCLGLGLMIPWAVLAQGGDENQAGLIVSFPDGSVETRCVSFSEPSITGAQLLERSGFEMVFDYNSGIGGAACSISGQGCSYPQEDCFCQCTGSDCEYWAYYHWVDGAWQYSQVGGSGYTITDGALEGWSWGPGNFVTGTEPPVIDLAEICASGSTQQPDRTDRSDEPGGAALAQYGAFLLVLLVLVGVGVMVGRRRA